MNRSFSRTFGPLVLLAIPALAPATVYVWPDVVPPCNTSILQACINAVASGDTVLVKASGTLNLGAASSLGVYKPISLLAAPGYRPSLPLVTGIYAGFTAAIGVNNTFAIEGFTLPNGWVSVGVGGSGNATVSLRHLDVTSPSYILDPLSLVASGYGTVNYEIAENRVQIPRNGGALLTAVHIRTVNALGATLNGRIHDNRLMSSGTASQHGIAIYPQGASTTHIYSNQISGNFDAGITLVPDNHNFPHLFDVISNAVDCNGAMGSAVGIVPVRSVGSLALQIFNNTVTGCYGGLSVGNAGAAGPLSGRIANNLLAYNFDGLDLSGLEANISNDHNLVFGNTTNNFTPGAGTVTADPLLRRGKYDARLTTGSSAIDAADSTALRNLLAADDIGEIDADGSRRFKGSGNLADIGAFEYGDTSFIQRASNSSSFVILNNPALNGNASARPQVTATRDVESYEASGSQHYVRFDYGAPDYYLYTEGGALHDPDSGFNVFVPGAGDGVLLHTTTVGSVSSANSTIDDAYLNGHADRVVLAHHRGSIAVPSLNEAISVRYLSSRKWGLQRNSGGNMPLGAEFHVYAQDPSVNAFFWSTPEVGDTSYTVLDHAVINGEPCAQIYAQQSGTFNPHPTQLHYVWVQQRWRIENADGALLPNATSFNVVVDEAATVACRYEYLFHDEFEDGF